MALKQLPPKKKLEKIIKSIEKNRIQLINLSIAQGFFGQFDIIDTYFEDVVKELKKLRVK